jgi:putative transcriptional regulator
MLTVQRKATYRMLERHMTTSLIEISGQLVGKMLIAMPGMGDTRFDQSVIYLCEHSAEGAMGLIVNKPAAGVVLGDVLGQLNIEVGTKFHKMRVHTGGPVETSRGFVLHTRDFQSDLNSLNLDDDFAMTGTMDVLEAMGQARGPMRSQLMLGYSGWSSGQLEEEIRQNGWLICEASQELVFDTDDCEKWSKALASIGVSPLTLSASAGRA